MPPHDTIIAQVRSYGFLKEFAIESNALEPLTALYDFNSELQKKLNKRQQIRVINIFYGLWQVIMSQNRFQKSDFH